MGIVGPGATLEAELDVSGGDSIKHRQLRQKDARGARRRPRAEVARMRRPANNGHIFGCGSDIAASPRRHESLAVNFTMNVTTAFLPLSPAAGGRQRVVAAGAHAGVLGAET